MHVCVHVYVLVLTHAGTYGGELIAHLVYFWFCFVLSDFFYGQGLSLNLEASVWLHYLPSEHLGFTCPFPPIPSRCAGATDIHYHTSLWCGCWGSELMFSCLLTKRFIHWAISSPLPHVFNDIVSLWSPSSIWNLLRSPGYRRAHIPLAFASQVMGLQVHTNTLSCFKLLWLDFHAMPNSYIVLMCTCHSVHTVFRAQLYRCGVSQLSPSNFTWVPESKPGSSGSHSTSVYLLSHLAGPGIF